jgi:assimilatory nitrate reductase catalytic subunit
MTETHTTCPYCGVGCGVVVPSAGKLHGDNSHPANAGRLCSKGAALGQTLDDTGRLTAPLIAGHPASWDGALDLVADRFRETIERHGPDSVAFYLSGQLLTEDYYVANKLMKGFIGSANIDTNSRLCMASTVAGHTRAFGEDVVPGVYDDWEQADLVVLVGSNTAWCHPVLHQRLAAARAARGTRVVAIDPRRTATAEAADLHLPIASGSDVALFNGLLAHLATSGAIDAGWAGRHVAGLADAIDSARADSTATEAVAARCGIDPEAVETFFAWFAATERVVTVFSQGVNQAADGTDRVNAIINCHLATGRIGRPGMGPFSLTGQPNAMGGREVGGLANQLAAHLRFDRPEDLAALRDFWRTPNLATRPGLKAVDLFDAVQDGRVKAIWIAATNPAASMPRAGRVAEALRTCPFVVVADCWPTDTTALADVVLPAAGWGEKDGTVTNSERCISRQRAFRAAPGQARPDWWMFCQLAARLGFAGAFAFDRPAQIFREHAALSGHANDGRRLFDISALAGLDDAAYDALSPTRWPVPRGVTGEGGRLFAHGGFPTADGRARAIPVRASQATAPAGLLLNTGRVRDQWHTMTRTGRVASLARHTPEPTLAINPFDAARLGIAADTTIELATEHGAVRLRAEPTHTQRRGELFAPMHWTRENSSAGPIGQAAQALADPHSGQPALKATPAMLRVVATRWHGLLLREHGGTPPDGADWVRITVPCGALFRLTGLSPLPTGAALAGFAARLLASHAAETLEMSDAKRGVLRIAALRGGVLVACLMVAPTRAALPPEDALADLLGQPVTAAQRPRLLSGRLSAEPASRRVCACLGVSESAIRHAAVTHRLRSAAEIGGLTGAGTNCGSCIPELEKILRDVTAPAA